MKKPQLPMKKFKGIRPFDEFMTQIEVRNWMLDATKFNQGGDYVSILFEHENTSGYALVNTVNGRFFGETTKGICFDSNNTTHDNEGWFIELLNVVLLPLEEPETV